MVPTRRLLDEAMPHWDVREQHARDVAAPVGDVWAALLSMPVRDLPVARLLMRVRTLRRDPLGDADGVLATGPRAKRAFAVYWRVVSGGSSLIRHELLRAVARRAEADRAWRG